MYSFHSSPEEKNKLLFALTQHGIETTVDRVAKKKRIRDWIQESVIQEEDDEEDEQVDDDGRELQTRTTRAPIAGHVSSVRAAEKAARTQIVSTVKDASNKHINPRTGKIQNGPSEMGHQSNEMHASPNHQMHSSNDKLSSNTVNTSSSENHRENNGHVYHYDGGGGGGDGSRMVHRRLLVDVGSQTSNELPKPTETMCVNEMPERLNAHIEPYEIKNSHSVPTISNAVHGTNPKTKNANHFDHDRHKMKATSQGYVSAFNSLATIAVPEIQQFKQPISAPTKHRERGRERSQSTKQSYLQRHKSTALAKQPISRSVHNLVNDSGYGSLDKLRPIDNSILSSPIFTKRSIIQTQQNAGGVSINERMHINGLSHTQNESSSPFHSDSGGDGSPRGSNGFVNLTGITTTSNEKPKAVAAATANLRMSMKDTAYDHVRSNRKNQWNDF